MSLVVIYRSDTYCPPCGRQIKKEHPRKRKFQRLHDSAFDSDEFPKGPMESDPSDRPLYCAECAANLEVELTAEGKEYVKLQAQNRKKRKA